MTGQSKAKPLTDRILEKCTPNKETGCLIWNGFSPGGYGKIRWRGGHVAVHRAMYEAANGPIPEGMCACHICDTPKCVNPSHIFIGTRAENNADKTRKGRQARGENHGCHGESSHFARITADQARQIRALYADGKSQREIAKSFGLSQPAISKIVRNHSWRKI